jgi:ribosomal protein S27E
MIGRYGPDHLGMALVAASLVVSLVSSAVGFAIGSYLSYLLLIFALIRMLSRNITRRRRENDRFLRYWWPIKTKVKRFFLNLKNRRTHRFFKCPSCKNTLRVPRGRGKLQITCPKCGERFIRKT